MQLFVILSIIVPLVLVYEKSTAAKVDLYRYIKQQPGRSNTAWPRHNCCLTRVGT
jgi:hypothetical protein